MRHLPLCEGAPRRNRATVSAFAGLSVTLSLLAASPARAEFLFGLSSFASNPNFLFSFDSSSPGTVNTIGNISGLIGSGSETVIGIDVRPVVGTPLFAVTNDGGIARLYTVNPITAGATLVSTLSANVTDASDPYTALDGTAFGVDFNPTGPVALRIVSNTGQNLRVGNPLALAGANTFTDGTLAAGIVGAGYTNNDTDPASGTKLYYINAGNDSLQTTDNANTPGPTFSTVGGLGVGDISDALGFDISGPGTAYAAVNIGPSPATSSFLIVNLANGAATSNTPFAASVGTVRGIAGLPNVAPEPGSLALASMGLCGLMGVALRRRHNG